jgi:diguanylate cyclase (GGDEF)-like protein
MRQPTAAYSPGQPDPALLHRLFFVQQVCLVLVAGVAAVALCGWLLAPLAHLLPAATEMSAPLALAALCCALSFFLSEPARSRRTLHLSRILAILTPLIATAVLLWPALRISSGLDALLNAGRASSRPGQAPLQPVAAFVLLALVMLLARVRKPLIIHVADLFTFSLCLLVLTIVAEYLFGALRFFRLSSNTLTSPQTLVCLLLLTFVAALRQSEHGVFSIFLGFGIASRIARVLLPVVILLPFLREAARARLIHVQLIPASYATAILTSAAVGFALFLLVFLAWRINSMEMKIQDLTLRDELTGLYNFRGFNLFAGQAFNLARRLRTPFSVLFIDLDNLKQINDELGHGVGSASLAETAKLLISTFRETDIIGRVGGDEFVVAGQFSSDAIWTSVHRLQAASASRSSESDQQYTLTFSIGRATADEGGSQSLEDLVTEADAAMYEEKRRKKLLSD